MNKPAMIALRHIGDSLTGRIWAYDSQDRDCFRS
jgi:hypothetical protein